MRDLKVALARNVAAAKWRLRYPALSAMYRQFVAENGDDLRKALLFDLAKRSGFSYQLDLLKDVLGELRAWQCLVLFMTKGLFGQNFTREQVAELAGVGIDRIHAACGSAKFIRASRLLD